MRVLVTGASGQVGSELVDILRSRAAAVRRGPKLDVIATNRSTLDVSDRDIVLSAVQSIEPDIIIHSAAMTAVDLCESEVDQAFAVNALGTRFVQEAAHLVDAHVVYVSTDYVFDGTSSRPYVEWDLPNPMSVYGMSKLGGESELDERATIVRTSWVCGRTGPNMVKTVLKLAANTDQPLRFVADQHGSPTIASDLAGMIVELGLERRAGIFHVTNQGATTWHEFAQAVVEFSGGDPARVLPISTSDLDPPRPAPRPSNSVLDNAALRLSGKTLLPEWRTSLRSLVAELSQ